MSITQPSVAAVRTLITTSLDDTGVQSMIDDATLVVEDCAGIVSATQTRQAAIIKWLAAHLISQQAGKGGQLTQESMGDASKSYAAGAGGLNISATRYGQQAILLDTSGCLEAKGKPSAFCELC